MGQSEQMTVLKVAEDELPPGQAPILTSNIRRMLAFLQFVLTSLPVTGYGLMAVITAEAGWGKTIAARACADLLIAQAQQALPAALTVKVAHKTSTIKLTHDVERCLGEHSRGRRAYEEADTAARSLVANGLPLLLFDEADRLTRETYELLRHLFDLTWCPLVLIGLPEIWNIITSQEKFKRRTLITMKFHPLSTKEIVQDYLPQVVLKHWAYDSKRDADRALGRRLWQHVGPSLGDLRGVLQVSSMIAEQYGEEQITPKTIERALKYSTLDPDIKQLELSPRKSDPSRPYEELSARRHAAARRKGKTP